ncbi:MAG: tripartite tricarboxylate transporter TctB family protein [Ruminococcaceae bacterium]|nr:tripartite tricarboxylate transporter TctB family protein [Oscillospiraceae bacterium]
MKKANIVSASIFAAVSVIVILYSLTFPQGTDGVPGPGMFPIIIASLMLLCSSLIIAGAFFSKDTSQFVILAKENKMVYITMAILALYIFLMPKIGFCVTSVPVLAGLIKWFSGRKLIACMIYAVLIVLAVFFVFNKILKVPLLFGLIF